MAEVKRKGEKVTKKTAPVYDPSKSYVWTPDDVFELNGNEFGLVYQALKNEVLVPGGTSQKQKVAAFDLLESILAQAVVAEIAKEHIPDPPPQGVSDN